MLQEHRGVAFYSTPVKTLKGNMPDPIPEPESKLEIKKDGLEGLIDSMPEPVPDAMAAAKAQDAQTKADQEVAEDKFGHKFDPLLHEVDNDTQQPKLTPSGRFKYKTGAKFKKAAESFLGITKSPEDKPLDPEKEKIKAAAVQFADSFIAAGVMIVGEEWKDEKGERDALIQANEQIFEKYGVVSIHPIANVTLVYGLYIFKRVMKPQSKCRLIWNGMLKQSGEFFKKAGDWFKYSILRKPRPVYRRPEEKKDVKSS